MPTSELTMMLFKSASEVMENMFFTTVDEKADPGRCSGEPWIASRLEFRGTPSGWFGVRMPLETGRKIASNFLGAEPDQVTDPQTGDVICELANMLCGSVLSRLDRRARFDLIHPKLDPAGAGEPEAGAAVHVMEHEDGPLVVWLKLGPAA